VGALVGRMRREKGGEGEGEMLTADDRRGGKGRGGWKREIRGREGAAFASRLYF
jgi:hypothetical protein